jgi:GntR family transcriptional regulator, arabinose operon transcriptional repressor
MPTDRESDNAAGVLPAETAGPDNRVLDDAKTPGTRRRGEPIYRQVERYLLQKIESGELEPGALLPSVKDLCEQFGGVNHLTVRQAIGNLAKRRLVRSVQGRGTFVTELSERGPVVRRIGVVLPHLGSELSASIARGAQNVFRAAGLQVIILDSQQDFQHEADNIHHLKHLDVEGALIFPTPQATLTEEIVHLKIDKFPFVLVDRALRDIQTHAVTVDNYGGSYNITKFLIEKGRKRLAWIGEWNVTSAQDRLAGCRDAILDAGLTCDRSLFVDVNDATRGGHEDIVIMNWIDEVLAMPQRPDAIVCGNDSTAIRVLHRLRLAGVAVPDEVAVTGFDDLEEAARTMPPLTTVRQPMERVGEEAARLLLQQIEKPDAEPQRIVIPVEIVTRESA